MALAECRFAGQPRDEALEKLSRIMHPPPSAPSRTAHVPKRQGEGREGKAAGVAGAGALTSGQNASVGTGGTASAGIAVEEAVSTERLIGAERVLERDRYGTKGPLSWCGLTNEVCGNFRAARSANPINFSFPTERQQQKPVQIVDSQRVLCRSLELLAKASYYCK